MSTKLCSAILLALTGTGCQTNHRAGEPFGKVYYIDGAGNWGFGTVDVARGLHQAGFEGDVEVFIWTTSLNPLLDQINTAAARRRARELAADIADYKKRLPDGQVSIIALSAGTGVAVWACEHLDALLRIDNLVMLGSSLSHNYDMNRALPNIKGKVYVYHSPHDAVLSAVEFIGTIDGKKGEKSAGQVGLQPPPGHGGKIVNFPWSKQWRDLGWSGGHTDCTHETFVREEIAARILPRPGEERVALAANGMTAGLAKTGATMRSSPGMTTPRDDDGGGGGGGGGCSPALTRRPTAGISSPPGASSASDEQVATGAAPVEAPREEPRGFSPRGRVGGQAPDSPRGPVRVARGASAGGKVRRDPLFGAVSDEADRTSTSAGRSVSKR